MLKNKLNKKREHTIEVVLLSLCILFSLGFFVLDASVTGLSIDDMYDFTSNESVEVLIIIPEINTSVENLVQQQAEIGKPVSWTLTITNTTVSLPVSASDILVTKQTGEVVVVNDLAINTLGDIKEINLGVNDNYIVTYTRPYVF